MDSIDTQLVAQIRHDIIHGHYSDDERLSEARLCDEHNVSRTPIRLALRLLEREGIVRRGEGRGYQIVSPTIEDIKQAVQVRGHLESLAARLMAQAENRAKFLPAMASSIEVIDNLVSFGRLDAQSLRQMQSANEVFHTTILEASGNDYIGFTCKQISHLPMLAAGSMVFDRGISEEPGRWEDGIFRLRIGNAQHKVIYGAIEQGDAVRAEGMMREHSHTMLTYIEMFETRDGSLTVSDLISYSASMPDAFTV